MARPKKETPKKATARKSTTTRTSNATTPQDRTAVLNLLKSTAETNASAGTRRPSNNPDVPKTFIDLLNHDLNAIKEMLETFAKHLRSLDRCPKAYGFWAGSLRYAQTPHIKSSRRPSIS